MGLLTYARTQIKADAMTTGEFTSFVIALLLLYEPVKRLTGIHNIFQQALGASQKVFEYLDRDQQVKEAADAAKLCALREGSSCSSTSIFATRHRTGRPGAQHVDLEVKAGEVVALVGPSGAGKTTLANLVPRFYDVTGGAIRIDGRDLRDLKLASLRDKISIVAQDTFLFNDTVAPTSVTACGTPRPNRYTKPLAMHWRKNSFCGCRRATTPSSASVGSS